VSNRYEHEVLFQAMRRDSCLLAVIAGLAVVGPALASPSPCGRSFDVRGTIVRSTSIDQGVYIHVLVGPKWIRDSVVHVQVGSATRIFSVELNHQKPGRRVSKGDPAWSLVKMQCSDGSRRLVAMKMSLILTH
jgi:hypothetical protein